MRFNTAVILRDYLLTILSPDLGTWANGAPAIWIGQPPANLAPATGIQCIIDPVPTSTPHPTSGGKIYQDNLWEVKMVNFPPRGAIVAGQTRQSLAKVARIIGRIPETRRPIYFAATADTAEQFKFQIFAPGFVDQLTK